MSDINLLPNADHKQNLDKQRENKHKNQDIEWSSLPEKTKKVNKPTGNFLHEIKEEMGYIKEDVSNFLGFNRKKYKNKEVKVEEPASSADKDKKVEEFRKEIDEKPKTEILNLKEINREPSVVNEKKKETEKKEINIVQDLGEKKPESEIRIKPMAGFKKIEVDSKFDINLIPSDLKLIKAVKKNLKIYVIVLSLILIIGLAGSLFIQQKAYSRRQNVEDIKTQKEQVMQTVVSLREKNKEVKDFTALLKEVKNSIDNHIYISNIFDFLEKNTLKEIYYTTLQVDTRSETAQLTVYAQDYEFMAKQIAHWQSLNNIIESLEANNVVLEKVTKTISEDETQETALVNFVLDIKFNKDFFLRKYDTGK